MSDAPHAAGGATARRAVARRAVAAALAAGGALAALAAARPAAAPALRVAVYADDAPFADGGAERGIDVELARAVGARLGAAVEVRAVPADDEMGDDLRRVLWRRRQADLFMHVPAGADFAAGVPQVTVVAPYFRETEVVARDAARLPRMAGAFDYGRLPIGVETGSLPDHFLLTVLDGRFRAQVRHFARTADAVAALRAGAVGAVVARRAQVEAALAAPAAAGAAAGGARVEVDEARLPGVPTTAWDVGIAVRADEPALAGRVAAAVAALRADGTLARIFAAHRVTYVPPGGAAPARPAAESAVR